MSVQLALSRQPGPSHPVEAVENSTTGLQERGTTVSTGMESASWWVLWWADACLCCTKERGGCCALL